MTSFRPCRSGRLHAVKQADTQGCWRTSSAAWSKPVNPWTVNDTLAHQAATAAGSHLDAPLTELLPALHAWIPAGSTAKAQAVEAGNLPPGLHPAAVIEELLSGSSHSWTCWPSATVTAAILNARGEHVELAAELRADPHSVPVDIHAVLIVDGRYHVDPCLGPGVPIALSGGSATGPAATAEVFPDDYGGWHHLSRLAGGPQARYVCLARHLDQRRARSFLAVSATHSGVPADRRSWRRTTDTGLVVVSERDGMARRRRWIRDGDGWRLGEERFGVWEHLVAA